jgi:site-specific recombinase
MEKQVQLKFYSFFTQYSLMEDYGFSPGLLTRLSRKLLKDVPDENTIEYYLSQNGVSIDQALELLNLENAIDNQLLEELDLSIKALGAKVVAFGLDNKIKSYFDVLNQDLDPFERLYQQLSSLNNCNSDRLEELSSTLEKTKSLIQFLRKNKHIIGTSFHLTVTTRSIIEYIERLQELINLKANINSKAYWEEIFKKHITFSKKKNSIRRFITRHIDLVALEIVEHNANKGEKYIADSKREYWSFFRKALLGGGIISIFALIKIWIDSFGFNQLQTALLYSINYATCFILVKQVGGIIATKQPAVTATTLAKGFDVKDDLQIDSVQKITILVRKVASSQFIAMVGNFSMAILFAGLIRVLLNILGFDDFIKPDKPAYLISSAVPAYTLLFYATIAGIFLALSGLISGFIDNKILATKMAYRLNKSKWFLGNGNFIKKKGGEIIGNISLGFFLGCAFLLSLISPISIDIRHIAFSSANIGYAIMSQDFSYNIIILAVLGVLLIGFINFLVSFSITLFLALKSRGANLKLLPKIIISVFKDWIKNPIGYYLYKGN